LGWGCGVNGNCQEVLKITIANMTQILFISDSHSLIQWLNSVDISIYNWRGLCNMDMLVNHLVNNGHELGTNLQLTYQFQNQGLMTIS